VIWNLYPDLCLPIPGAVRSKRRGSEAARVMGSRFRIPPRHGCLFLVKVVCRQVEFSALDRSPVQRSPSDCGVSEGHRAISIIRRP
jgi:hypothetical protein